MTADDLTDKVLRLQGLDPEALSSEPGRRKFADSYGRTQKALREMVAKGGDPDTVRVEDGKVVMDLVREAA